MARRRDLVLGGAAVAAAALTGIAIARRGGSAPARTNPMSAKQVHMPPESAAHERTFMQWPQSMRVYDRVSLDGAQRAIVRIANAISEFEPVVLLGAGGRTDTRLSGLSSRIERWDIPTDDLWCRDSGPTFVVDPAKGLSVAQFNFNGWGNKQPHPNDGQVCRRVAEWLGLPLIETGLVGEQGGLEHDGAGTLLAHASCWDNPNRNKLPRAEITRRLLKAVGGTKMIWAPGVAGQDITDYHIDALARFTGPGQVLIQIDDEVDPDDPWSVAAHQTLAVLEDARDASGNRLKITKLPEAREIRSAQPDFVASYINYYVCNGAIIAAQFGDPRTDEIARATLQKIYADRTVVMLDVDPIGAAGGGIHCATQQQPRV